MKFTGNRMRRHLLRELAEDNYGIRATIGLVDNLVDVGGNVGMVSMLFRLLHPHGVVMAFEPDPAVYAILCDNTAGLNVATYNEALGDGSMFELVPPEERCCSCIQYRPAEAGNALSAPLDKLMARNPVNLARTMLKVDCECGEKFLMGHKPSEDLLKQFGQISMELHAGYGLTPQDYNNWLGQILTPTHKTRFWSGHRNGRIAYFRAESTSRPA